MMIEVMEDKLHIQVIHLSFTEPIKEWMDLQTNHNNMETINIILSRKREY